MNHKPKARTVRFAARIATLLALVASVLTFSGVTTIQPASAATTYCTWTAGEPVVVVENGVRYLQSYSTVRCTAPVYRIAASAHLQNSAGTVVKSGNVDAYNTTAVNLRIRAVCSNVRNNNYRTLFYPVVYWAGGGSSSPNLATPWTLRSCG